MALIGQLVWAGRLNSGVSAQMLVMRWLRQLFERPKPTSEASVAEEIVTAFSEEQQRTKSAGAVDGEHYTDYVEQVKLLKRQKRHDEAIELLTQLVEATEAESRAAGAGWGVAPWYYEQLAIIYRKERRYRDEVKILRRYKRQPKAPGAGPLKLSARLDKALKLLEAES